MNNENNLRTFLRLIAWRIVARWMTNEGLKMTMPSINIQIINTLNNTHKGKTMSVQPVELSKAYRLLQVGSTTMISAKYDGVENVMSAAWVGLAGERKVVAYIGTQAFTRQLVEKSGYFVVQIPVVSQMATVLYAGGRSYADAPDKNDTIPFFYQPGSISLVAGCAGWLVCKVMPTRTFSNSTICLWAISSPPGAMTGYSATDTGSLMMRRTSYGPFTMSQAGSSMPSAKAANSIMDRVRTDPPRS
jgi:flavin reductase (DIM6/NTAB) family NADH-FMN oxidoreductase RutF